MEVITSMLVTYLTRKFGKSIAIALSISIGIIVGVIIYSHEDGLLINGLNSLHGAKLYCDSDHRMTMLAGIAALISEKESELMNIDSVNISYPNFWNDFEKLCVS